jgi:regulator of sigma E protease
MSILIFLLALSVLVFVHEFGHFIAAKKSGVKVDEFGFGLPPRIFGRKVGDTLYSINLLPIGGFVKLKGEDGEVLGFGSEGSFVAASNPKRLIIVLAGVVGNLLLAYLIFVLLFLVGNPTMIGKVIISNVAKNSPAEASQIKPNDYVLKVDGVAVTEPQDFINRVNNKKGIKVDIVVEREGSVLNLTAIPRVSPPSGEGPLGVVVGFDSHLTYRKAGFVQAATLAGQEIYKDLALMVLGLKSMLNEMIKGRAPTDIAGVVGIYKFSAQALEVGYRIYLQLVALISLNLFMFNLLPIPALDGGRLLFIIIEMVTRKKISPKVEKVVNNFGLALLLALFVLVTIRDIKRF